MTLSHLFQRSTKLLLAVALILPAASAYAVSGTEVQLRASTVPHAPLGTVGILDTTDAAKLIFHAPSQPDIVMPYTGIAEFGLVSEDSYHLGILAAIVFALAGPRQQTHLLSISYKDENDVMQVATFELSKHLPETLHPVLQGRARNACERREYGGCTPVVEPPRPPRVAMAKPEAN